MYLNRSILLFEKKNNTKEHASHFVFHKLFILKMCFNVYIFYAVHYLIFTLFFDFYSYFEYDFFQTQFSLPVASLRFNAVCLSALFVHHIWRNQNKPIFFMTFYNAKKKTSSIFN